MTQAQRLWKEHQNWIKLFHDAKRLNMYELAIMYSEAGIACGFRMLEEQSEEINLKRSEATSLKR